MLPIYYKNQLLKVKVTSICSMLKKRRSSLFSCRIELRESWEMRKQRRVGPDGGKP